MKYVHILITCLILALLFTGCGGGGGSTGGAIIPVVDTPVPVTPAAQATATPITGHTPDPANTPSANPTATITPPINATATSTPPVNATATITPEVNATATGTPAQGNLTGKVYDLFTNGAVKDANISINGKTATTDSAGNYTITSAGTGTYRMTVSGNFITRSFPVDLSGGIQNVSILPSDFNTTMFRALSKWPGHDGTGRWETKPVFVIYKYMWDDPNVAVSQATLDKIASVVAEVGGLADGFFSSPVIEYYNGSAASDPRWTVSYETPEWGYITYGHNAIGISMIQTLSGDNAGFGGGLCDGDSWIRGGGVVLSAQYKNYISFKSNLRHEIGHTFPLWHPFENLSVSDPNMEESVMNYWPQGSLYGKRSDGYSDADKKALTVIYHRGPDNHAPDTDPDKFIGYHRNSDKLYEFVSK
ncbi:MAG: hypothetical protein ABRQ37_21775 [Candidatus Eremiobacterota bacterium]